MYYTSHYGSYDSYDSPALYGYSTSTFDPSSGYTHTHQYYANALGTYERTFDENRGPNFDRTYQNTQSYASGVYTSEILNTTTPLDGMYASYGTRYNSTYDINDRTATTNAVTFSSGYSSSVFHSEDYSSGTSVASYDTRFFYSGGYYEYNSSYYSGPGGNTSSAGGAYHYNSFS